MSILHTMKAIFNLLIALSATFMTVDAADTEKQFATGPIRDLALIYQGGAHRPDWTQRQFEPYVSHTFADGSTDWLFDGFLFLEFKDGEGRQFSPGYDKLNARRSEWERYLDRLFERGKSLDALDRCIDTTRQRIRDPGFRHKIILTVMVPIIAQTDWGEINGQKLDFNRLDDRKAACRWFIDQLVSRFAAQKYKNIDLSGLYWIDEDMVHTQDFPKDISSYIHSKGLQFVWIPYFKAPGHDRWRELGFDIAYHQPNHFFDKKIPDARLDRACDIALDNGMAMEFECDERANYNEQDSYIIRIESYIEAFQRRGVFDNSAIAYYTGGTGLNVMADNPCPENRAVMDRLARLIVNRRANHNLINSR